MFTKSLLNMYECYFSDTGTCALSILNFTISSYVNEFLIDQIGEIIKTVWPNGNIRN